MALSTIARAAMALAAASALTFDSQKKMKVDNSVDTEGFSMKSDLPRYVLQTAQEDGCGDNVTGYLLVGQGLLWSDGRRGTARSVTDCRQKCDTAKNCVGFTTRQPRSGKLQCSQYMGLIKKYDPRGMSYSKCMKGFKCADGNGYLGFQFSHQGSWKNGVKANTKSLGTCSKECRQDRSCVGFTHRHTKDGIGECYHYKNTANSAGPRRDMRANTYSKCMLSEQSATAPHGSTPMPNLPFTMATVSKTATPACNNGYVASSNGWWWQQYDALVEVDDRQACASACTSSQKCMSFVYRASNQKKAECYMYNGVASTLKTGSSAFLKCPTKAGNAVGNDCDKPGASKSKNRNMTAGNFMFSHSGIWEGGTKFDDVKMQGCNIICFANPSCTAMSWQPEGSVCTTYEFKASSARATPAAGAEGYTKCNTAEEPQV